jgi:hypothetical protein
VLNSLNSADAKRGYRHAKDEFVDWYCSEPRWAFNRIVVLRYRSLLESRQLAPAPSICVLALCAGPHTKRPTADMCSALPRIGRRVGADPISLGARFGANDRTLPWLQATNSISRQLSHWHRAEPLRWLRRLWKGFRHIQPEDDRETIACISRSRRSRKRRSLSLFTSARARS